MECTSAEPLLLLAADAWTKKSSVSCRRRALSLESLESHKSHNSIRCLLSQRKELWLSHNECPSGGFQSGPGPGTRRALKLGTQRCLNGTHPFKDPMYEMLTYRLMDHRKPRQKKVRVQHCSTADLSSFPWFTPKRVEESCFGRILVGRSDPKRDLD